MQSRFIQHLELIDIIHTWNLTKNIGYCYGYIGTALPFIMEGKSDIFVKRLSVMGQLMQAIIDKDTKIFPEVASSFKSEDKKLFDELIVSSTQTPAQIFCQIVNLIYKYKSVEFKDDEAEKSNINILRTTFEFCKRMANFQLPSFFQDMSLSLAIFPQDELLKAEDSVVFVDSFSCYYTHDELIKYLCIDELTKNLSFPLGLLLQNKQHAVLKVGDSLFDINQPPNQKLTQKEGASSIIKAIFCDPKSEKKEIVFATTIFVKKKHLQDAKAVVEKWKQQIASLHDFTNKTDLIDASGKSWLYLATEMEENSTVKKLLESKADANFIYDRKKSSPLFVASEYGDTKMVKLLIQHKASVNMVRSTDGATPLIAAVFQGGVEVADLLLSHKADVNAALKNDTIYNDHAETSLHIAASKGTPAMVKLLLQAHANLTALTSEGYTPVQLAAQRGEPQVIQMLTSTHTLFSTSNQQSAVSVSSSTSELTEEEEDQLAEEELERITNELGI